MKAPDHPDLIRTVPGEMATHSSVLAWRIPGMGDCTESDTTEATQQQQQQASPSCSKAMLPEIIYRVSASTHHKQILPKSEDTPNSPAPCSLIPGPKCYLRAAGYTPNSPAPCSTPAQKSGLGKCLWICSTLFFKVNSGVQRNLQELSSYTASQK